MTKGSLDVTMFQRSSTYIMSVEHGIPRLYGGSFVCFYEMFMVTRDLLE